MAVDRFVSVGETIAEENREIEESMCEASKEARIAGGWFVSVVILTGYFKLGQIILSSTFNLFVGCRCTMGQFP